ncbi:uncharacterized protein [Diadema setosum]|uniref:uncharacterized protein n=1 Tax=Diadema setosum TaxID=31175 RepID=UPI003B3A87A5
MSSRKSARKRRETASSASDGDGNNLSAGYAETAGEGKGASSLQPLSTEQLSMDYRAGVVMALTFPLAILFFWKVTLPVTWFVVKTVLGEQLILKLFFLKQDLLSILTEECPSWIPAEERFFLDDRLEETVRRLPSPETPEEFEELILQGEPIVITNAMKGWESFGTWDCDTFRRQYKDVEYFDWQAGTRYKLANITNRPGYEGMKCASGYIEGFWPENAKYLKDWLKKMSPLPAFLPRNAMSPDSNLTGFLGVPGTGVSPHLDETCDTFMTAQFSGVKNWSLSWPVREDGQVKWRKPVVFTLYPGDLMFWFANMRHHTEVIHGCSLSFTFRLHTPVPKIYFTDQRKLVLDLGEEERLRLYGETHSSDMYFMDKCRLVVKGDQVFVH